MILNSWLSCHRDTWSLENCGNGLLVYLLVVSFSYFFLSVIAIVDDLEQCSAMVGKDDKRVLASTRHLNASKRSSNKEGAKPRQYFPFKQGYLAIATLRVGVEGIQMTVDGKHITSFAYREVL